MIQRRTYNPSEGKEPKAAYNSHPYRHLQPAFSWKAPNA